MKTRQKRLMILGAGTNQLAVVRKALERGLFVVTVDYLPHNVCHAMASLSVNCSTMDKEGVLKAARELHIDGIMTFASDVAAPTAAFVAGNLGLPGAPRETVNRMVYKEQFRKCQLEKRVNTCRCAAGKTFGDIEREARDLRLPLVFKPVDSSGSRGIARVDSRENGVFRKAFEEAQKMSRSGTVCAEELAPGLDVSGDVFVGAGRVRFGGITRKHIRWPVPLGHSLPPALSDEEQRRVLGEVEANCAAVGYSDGPLDFDARVTPDAVTVLEASPRLGGNGIPMVIERATQTDLTGMAIAHALGEAVDGPAAFKVTRPCGSWIFGTPFAGRLEEIATPPELKEAVPEVFDSFINYRRHDEVPEFTHSGTSLGCVWFDVPDGYEKTVDRIRQALRLKVSAAAD